MAKTVEVKGKKIALSVREAAELTSLSQDFLWQLIRAGRLEAAHIGRRVLLMPEALERFISEGVKK